MPLGGGPYEDEPAAGAAKIHRARQDAPLAEEGKIQVAAKLYNDGYDLEGHIPAEVLAGFEPVAGRRIGLYYMLEDREMGQQYLTVGDDLYWYVDPSVWGTAVLAESAQRITTPNPLSSDTASGNEKIAPLTRLLVGSIR